MDNEMETGIIWRIMRTRDIGTHWGNLRVCSGLDWDDGKYN